MRCASVLISSKSGSASQPSLEVGCPTRGWQTASVRYDCDQCGACCRQFLVEADEIDVLREPRLAQADPHYAKLTIEETLVQLQDEFRVVLVALPGRPCMFLNDNKCSIYPTRPNVCVGMLAGDEQCQEARQREGLLPLPPLTDAPGV